MSMVFGSLSATQKFGLAIENFVYRRLLDLGYVVEMCNDFNSLHFDLLVDGEVRVEVKASAPNIHSNGLGTLRWRCQWNLRASEADYFVFVAVCAGRNYSYVVPASALRGRKNVSITSHPIHFSGWLDVYFEAWYLLESEVL